MWVKIHELKFLKKYRITGTEISIHWLLVIRLRLYNKGMETVILTMSSLHKKLLQINMQQTNDTYVQRTENLLPNYSYRKAISKLTLHLTSFHGERFAS